MSVPKMNFVDTICTQKSFKNMFKKIFSFVFSKAYRDSFARHEKSR